MFFTPILSLALALLPFTASQTVHDIQVGGAGGALVFDPEAIAANPGDQVVFHFHPKNHTVTQSSFASPCGPKAGGIDSGFMPVPANTTDNFPTYTITVNDTQPVWVYCRQASNTPASHCGQGMVFAVNCGQDGAPNSFTNFKASALAIGASLSASAAPSATSSAGYGAGYGDATAAPTGVAVTEVITLATSTWTTTYTSYPNSPAPTPASVGGNIINVKVGGPGVLAFDPPHVQAQPRDTIVFEFHEKNHTVTQSSFASPCVKLNSNGTTGFDSGFFPVASDATTFPTWNLTVNDTAPIWAYCRQLNHCGAGMVFAVNSDESSARNYSAFQSLAKSLNGTATTSSASPSQTAASANAGGAVPNFKGFPMGGVTVALVLGALTASFL
jgi:plastocyanin